MKCSSQLYDPRRTHAVSRPVEERHTETSTGTEPGTYQVPGPFLAPHSGVTAGAGFRVLGFVAFQVVEV